MKRYMYEDMKDKSKEGILKETSEGLGKIAFYFQSVMGFPLELFKEELEEKCPTDAHKLNFYMSFRNEHPELWETE